MIFLLHSLCTAVQAQTRVTRIENYTGKIGSYPIALTIEFNQQNDSLFGHYYYLKNGRDAKLFIEGKQQKGNLAFVERDYKQRSANNEPIITGNLRLEGVNSLHGDWKNPKTNKSLIVQLSKLSKSGQEQKNYRFKFSSYRAKMENAGTSMDNYTRIKAMEIYKGQVLYQRITGFDECVGKGSPEVILEDLNFDGILDVKVPIYFPQRTKYDGAFLYFIYNPLSKKFELNKQMVDLEYLNFDAFNKELYKFDQAPEGFVRNIFQWRGNKLLQVRSEPD